MTLLWQNINGAWTRYGRTAIQPPPPPPPPPPPDPAPTYAGMTLLYDEQFASLDPTRWGKESSTFGSPTRIQRYRPENILTGAGTTGSTGGTSMKLLSKREFYIDRDFTAGMVSSKAVNRYYPRYGRYEFRCKIPHGQGLWPALWLTHRVGGADTFELDIMEYFHSQIPGKVITTLHRADNTGVLRTNVSKNYGGAFFEAPTYTPGWHTYSAEIIPESGDPNSATTNVRFRGYVDGVKVWDYLDTQSLYWTSQASDDALNIYIQGCQIDGNYVGHPDDPLGYSHWLNQCISGGGTPPDACRLVVGGYPIIRAQFGDPSSTVEIDFLRVYKYTG